jgi:hypothetical protein
MKGLKYCKSSGAILVFTDDVVLAKEYLKQIDLPMIYITGNKDYEDLYLMHLCKNIICSPSSFSWWAAYLNAHHDKKIVVPQFWFLPGGTAKNEDIFVHGWKRIRAHRWYDYYYIRYIPNLLLINHKRVRKVLGILSSKIRARI